MHVTSSSIAMPTDPDAGRPWCNAENLDVIFPHLTDDDPRATA
jgi:hypothetical protein